VQFLVSAGEASGDMYAAQAVSRLVSALRPIDPTARFYGCAGPKLQALGVEPVIDAASLSVVGLAEVVGHLPRIYREYRRLVHFAERNRPVAALLVDNPDFNLRLARQLKRLGVPTYYLVAPQVWAWRPGRVKTIREVVDKLFCLFPFEEPWFRQRGVDATYIGHPLAAMVRARLSRPDFFARRNLRADLRTLTLLPGSRPLEIRRHLPVLLDTVALLRRRFALNLLLAIPSGFHSHRVLASFREPLEALSIQVVENETWDCIGHADLALAASGTVTVEAAVLGTPMVTFYKVNPLSWWAGRRLVKVPFLCMVNLIAGRSVVPELMQADMTPQRLAHAAEELLANPERSDRMRAELASVRAALTRPALTQQNDPLGFAAELIARTLPIPALPLSALNAQASSTCPGENN
jgi:lipid-A-disaccharide synthase